LSLFPAMLSLAIILLSLSAILGARVPDSQRQAVVKVLQALQCSSPVCTGNVENTLRATDFCPSNQGVVRCNGNGDVTGIDMRECAVGRTGSLAPEIGALTDLQLLFVFAGQCTLQGSLPNMATLTQLDNLELQGSFSGSLPVFFGSSTSLTRLALTGNDFSSVFQFTQQSKLQELRIENNPNLAGNLGLLPPTLTRLWMQNSVVTANFSALTTPFASAAPGEEAACQLSQRYTCGNCIPALLNCKCGSNTFCTTTTTTATTAVTTTATTTTTTATIKPLTTPTTTTTPTMTTKRPTTTTSTTFGVANISSSGAPTVMETTIVAVASSISAALPVAITTGTDSMTPDNAETAGVNWIDSAAAIPTIGGVAGGVAGCTLLGIAAYCIARRRRRGNVAQSAAPTEMHTARADSQRALSAAGDPGAHYGIVPVAKQSSHYLERAGEFKVAQSEPHHYAALSATEAGEREPHYAVPTTTVHAASAEPESPYDVLSDEETGRATGAVRST
jgi:hypothetical protein